MGHGPAFHTRDGGHNKTLHARTTPQDAAAGQAFLQRMLAGTEPYKDLDAARAAGYDVSVIQKQPNENEWHVPNAAFKRDGRVADPSRPEALVYRRARGGGVELIGIVFSHQNGRPPDLPMGQWHTHDGSNRFMKHMWRTNNVAAAYSEQRPKNPV